VFIKSKNKTPLVRGVILAVLLTLIAANPAAAVTQNIYMVAIPLIKNVNEVAADFADDGIVNGSATGELVPMWAYARVTGATPMADWLALDCGVPASLAGLTPTVPGPLLKLDDNVDVLDIRLYNCLPVPTSIGINGLAKGLAMPMTPKRFMVGPFAGRIRSLDVETNPGMRRMYEWSAAGQIPPGTYLYRSVTHQQVQVPMGLYGALTEDYGSVSPPEAYPGYPYNTEKVLVYSEVDPDMNAAVAADAADNGAVDGSAGGFTSAFNYNPQYFLLTDGSGEDGTHRAYRRTGNLLGGIEANENLLLRIVNAGLRTIVPNLVNLRCQVIAEDASPYPFPRDQYSVEAWAGSTRDCLIGTPPIVSDTIYPLIERRTTGLNREGGQLIFLNVTGSTTPIVVDDTFGPIVEDSPVPLTVFAPGVLVNDSPGVTGLTVVGPTSNGVLLPTLASDGSFTYTPDPDFSGFDSFTYQGTGTNIATVTIEVSPVNDAPVANADSFTLVSSTTPSDFDVLDNDTDIDGDQLTVTGLTQPVVPGSGVTSLNPDGTVNYDPQGFVGVTSFTYFAFDGTAPSGVTTADISTFGAPPVAENDGFIAPRLRSGGIPGTKNTCLPVVFNLVDNDTTAGGLLTITIVDTPSNGGTVTDLGLSNGKVEYFGPLFFKGTETFTYTVADANGTSNLAMVSVNLLGQRAFKTQLGIVPVTGPCTVPPPEQP